jgi:hypothetical protein
VIGLLLWFHVATEKIYHHQFRLVIEEIVLGDSLTLSEDVPDSMLVNVSATGKQLLRSGWKERGLRINAGSLRRGPNLLMLNTSNTILIDPAGLITLEEIITPTKMMLMIDELAETTIKVVADISITPDEGLTVARISEPEPAEVLVSGPQGLLRDLTYISTERVVMSKVRDDLTIRVPLLIPDGYSIRLRPDSVALSIQVVPVKTRVFENVPIMIYNAPPDRQLSLDPTTIRVEVTGPPTEVDQLAPGALIVSIQFSPLDTSAMASLKVDVPSGFTVKRYSPDSTRVTLR